MKRTLTVVIGFLIIFIAVIGFEDIAAPKTDVDKTTIKIAVSTTPLSSPLFIAEKQGMFKKYGLNVELVPTAGGVKSFELLTSQIVDFATASETVVMFNSFFKDDFTVLASFVESDNDLKLLSLDPEKYKDFNNFEHARIGLIKNSASEFFLDSLLIMFDRKHIPHSRVYLSPDELIPALVSNKVDIISAWAPIDYKLYKITEKNNQIISSKGLYNLSFVLASHNQNKVSLTQKKQLLRALSEAIDFIFTYPHQAQQIISDTLAISTNELTFSWDDYNFRMSLSNALLTNLQTQSQWAVAAGLVPAEKQADLRRIIDKSILESNLRHELEQ